MTKQRYIVTERDLIKASVMVVMSAVFFGLSGVLLILFFHWTARRSYASDTIDKHGISIVAASRLGGASVILGCFGILAFAGLYGISDSESASIDDYLFIWAGTLSCGLLGLMEDLRNGRLSPIFRLIIKLIVFGLIVAKWPFLIPSDLGVPFLDLLLSLPLSGWALTVIFSVGFINAVNMADGANGLMPGILTISFMLFYLETGALLFAALATCCGLFTMFNIISGRLFLGDTGTYGLGAALAISGLYLHSLEVFSAAFLAVLFAYPCIDFLVSLFRRSWQGRSVFSPDNDHLHNRVYYLCQQRLGSKTLANSITGCGISIVFSGIALVGYLAEWLPVTSDNWIFIFLIQCSIYAISFFLSGLNRPQGQYSASR